MALRLIEMVCPAERAAEVEELVQEHEPYGLWQDQMMGEQVIIKILLPAEKAESVLDELQGRYSWLEGFRVLLLSVEAAIPRPEPEEAEKEEAEEGAEETEAPPARISRQELYAGLSSSAELTRVFLALIALSSVVAAMGMVRDNVPVIIGAMVIAPLLGPNMALAFSATLGDAQLLRDSLKTGIVGILTALLLSVALGIILNVSPETREIALRARVSLGDVVLALAAGAAGALAFTTGIHTPLVGVMVAVALLPPLVLVGLGLGSRHWSLAGQAALLFSTNLICVNLAGVATFMVRGIRPRTWWEAGKARRASRLALLLWVLLLGLLVALIWFSRH